MRTQYLRRHNDTRRVFILGACAVVAVLVLGVRFFTPNFFFALMAPLLHSSSSVTASVGDAVSGLTDSSQLAAQNRALEDQVLALRNQNQALTTRTQDLTKLLGGTREGSGSITAGVLARPPESPYDTLVVAAGSKNAVVAGSEVFAQGGIPIGTVEHVGADTSQVSLFSLPGRTTSGWVGENRIALTLTGAGAGAFTATLSKDSSVSVGDLVYLPGPGAIPMGTVARVDTDPSSPTEVIHVQPSVNLFSITWVVIGNTAP